MNKKKSISSEIDQVFAKLIEEEFNPCTCQIFKHSDKGKMLPYGSGVFVQISCRFFLFTASHVIEGMLDTNQLYFRIRSGFVSIVGEVQETDLTVDSTIDLAYVLLDERIVKELKQGYKFIPLSKLRVHNKLLDASQYCVIGFPEKNKKLEEDKLKTGTSSYFVRPSKEKVYEYYGFNKDSCYIFDFMGKGTDIRTGYAHKINTDVHGISGCGLWLVILDEIDGKYIADFRLIGIMTEFRKGKYHCLIGNKLELLLGQLKSEGFIQVREKKMYYKVTRLD